MFLLMHISRSICIYVQNNLDSNPFKFFSCHYYLYIYLLWIVIDVMDIFLYKVRYKSGLIYNSKFKGMWLYHHNLSVKNVRGNGANDRLKVYSSLAQQSTTFIIRKVKLNMTCKRGSNVYIWIWKDHLLLIEKAILCWGNICI